VPRSRTAPAPDRRAPRRSAHPSSSASSRQRGRRQGSVAVLEVRRRQRRPARASTGGRDPWSPAPASQPSLSAQQRKAQRHAGLHPPHRHAVGQRLAAAISLATKRQLASASRPQTAAALHLGQALQPAPQACAAPSGQAAAQGREVAVALGGQRTGHRQQQAQVLHQHRRVVHAAAQQRARASSTSGIHVISASAVPASNSSDAPARAQPRAGRGAASAAGFRRRITCPPRRGRPSGG
jgi:hypothetical protein